MSLSPSLAVMAAGGLMDLRPGLTLWTAITFLILLAVLSKFAWKPIVKMLDERERTIFDAIEQARKERAEAERMMNEQKSALAQARKEAADLSRKNQEEIEALRADLTARARKEADDLVQTARRQIDEQKVQVIAELKGQVADMAIAAAGSLIKASLDEKSQRALVEEYIAKLPPSGARP